MHRHNKELYIKLFFIWHLLLAAFVLFSITAYATEHEAGLQAFQHGDYEKAYLDWKPLAEEGDPSSQFYLGVLYENGWGTATDYTEAIIWYRKAANQGVSDAEFNLGVLYENGEGIPQNYEKAFDWYSKAAKNGRAKAQNNLGALYEYGYGVGKDNILAHMWYNLAGSQGETRAHDNRNEIAKKMKASEITSAQKWAIQCLNSNYDNC